MLLKIEIALFPYMEIMSQMIDSSEITKSFLYSTVAILFSDTVSRHFSMLRLIEISLSNAQSEGKWLSSN